MKCKRESDGRGQVSDKFFAFLMKGRNMTDANSSFLLPTLNMDTMPEARTAICEHKITSMKLKAYMLRLVARKCGKRLGPDDISKLQE